ncbi:MAG: hypothetical protein JWQ11_3042, partial [Rhizobacter sp.]|nr:hypothetical protein [Rhizobacter sp.]
MPSKTTPAALPMTLDAIVPGRPLQGLRVVEMGSVVLAPYAGQLLAALGAEVVKIEPPAGDLSRHIGTGRPGLDCALFLNCNQGKQSVVIDVKKREGLELVHRLLATADVFLHNMRLEAVERLGLGFDALHTRNERLVYCACYGYGASGRDRARPAYDDIIQAASGIAALGEKIGGAAAYAPTIVADKSTA